MDIEYKHQKRKLDKFGETIMKAPFNPIEAHIAYQSRYISKATYSFPITLFTTQQLHEIQQKAIYNILPKLGVNRHAPQAMIFGPMKYGGRQITDLRIEQPVMHINTTLGHLRRGGNTSSALQITLKDIQIEVGTTQPFYNLDPSKYSYCTKDTRWRYFWETIAQYNIKGSIYNMWTPQAKYEDDENIMEKAAQDPFYCGKEKYRIVSINQC